MIYFVDIKIPLESYRYSILLMKQNIFDLCNSFFILFDIEVIIAIQLVEAQITNQQALSLETVYKFYFSLLFFIILTTL